MKRKIYQYEPEGQPTLLKTCDCDKSFITAVKSILANQGVQIAELKKITTVSIAIHELQLNGFGVTEKEPDIYEQAIDENPHLGKYIRQQKEQDEKEPDFQGMQISKIKIKKDEKFCEILYYKNGNRSTKEVKFNGYEPALEEFICNLREMSKHVVDVLEFPEEWLSRVTTTSLSITWKEGNIMGMVITAQMQILGLNCPLNLNTPFIEVYSWAVSNDSCNDVHFSKECEELLEKIISNAKAYMLGETATKQQNLFEQQG